MMRVSVKPKKMAKAGDVSMTCCCKDRAFEGIFFAGIIGAVILMAVVFSTSVAGASQTGPDSVSQIAVAGQAAARDLVDDLGVTLSESLEAEQKNLAAYQERLARADREQLFLTAAVNGYQLQLSTFGNLLLSAGVDLAVLQKTRAELRSSLISLQKMIDDLAPMLETLSLERENLTQQKSLVEKQIKELSRINAQNRPGKNNSDKAGGNTATVTLEKTARALSAVLKEKEIQVTKLDTIYRKHMTGLTEQKTAFTALVEKYDAAIAQLKNRDLFERRKAMFRINAFRLLSDETLTFMEQLKTVLQPEFWEKGVLNVWQSAGLVSISLIFVLGAVFTVMQRMKKTAGQMHRTVEMMRLGPWHALTADLLLQSVVPAGLAAAILMYSRLDTMYLLSPVLEMTALILLVILIFRWTATVGGCVNETETDPAEDIRPLGAVVKAAAFFSLVYFQLRLSLGPDAGTLVILRMAGAFCLLIWTLRQWRHLRLADVAVACPDESRRKMMALGVKYFLVVLAGVALVMDMIGYGSLSAHWTISWGKTVLIIFWGGILLALIREWDRFYNDKSKTQHDELLYDEYPVQWLMIRAGQFVWLISLVVLLLLVWGNQETVLGRLYEMLAHPIVVGNMSFSLMGMLYAVLVLLITYALTRIWKWVFQLKFLSRSGMEIGLQDSITTITVYLIWMFGILVSLHLFGLNTASLAVAFGALGIGLGFGLQNIFNNFISGIILLFERPIQVGDDVEINGTWAQVKKINVRSTVVQTYDNASLIIPNADFISSQVTNWSFKDKRLRRNIEVGVAYGSDIERVKDTLLEIAETTPKVLKRPAPDIWFRDFGDSALIFRLRIWTDINNMLRVETDIRFRIDKLFRERGIEISFPQRDIHIRSVAGQAEDKTPLSAETIAKPDPDNN